MLHHVFITNEQNSPDQQLHLDVGPPAGAVPVDGGVLALRVHDVDDDGVWVDVVGGAGVVPGVIRRDRGDLNLGHEISIFFIKKMRWK